MSWDVSMRIETGNEMAVVQYVRNVTYNNSKIFRAVGAHPDDLEGKTGEEAMPVIESALLKMSDLKQIESLRLLEPANGWGGLVDAQSFLRDLYEACATHTKAKVHFS